MANSDTIAALFGPGTARNQINSLVLTTTAETLFVVSTDTSGTTNTATLAVPTGNSTANTLVGSGSPVEFNQNPAISSQSYGRKVSVFTEPPYFSSTTFDLGRPFRLRIQGNASLSPTTVTASPNTLVVNIYNGTAITATYKITAMTAGLSNSSTTATLTGQFYIEALVQWDSTTQTISGVYDGNIGNTIKAQTALANQVAVTTASKLIFTPSAVFASGAGGTVNVVEFAVDQV
jgi:hypothetical protein